MATSPVFTVLLSALPGKRFSVEPKVMKKTGGITLVSLLSGRGRVGLGFKLDPRVLRLVKTLCNHFGNPNSARSGQ
jgi:hypothetical protein